MKITIIGAGIGGLTTAIALKQKGFEIEIFEAAPKELGLYDTVFEAGSLTNSMNITDEKLNSLSVIDLKHFEEKFKVKSVANTPPNTFKPTL